MVQTRSKVMHFDFNKIHLFSSVHVQVSYSFFRLLSLKNIAYAKVKCEMWNVKSSSGLLHLLECAWASIHWSMKAATFISSITSAQIHSFFCWCVGYAIFIIVRTCSWIILSHTFPSLLLLFNEHFQINLLNKLLLKKNRFCVATMKLLWMVSDEMS